MNSNYPPGVSVSDIGRDEPADLESRIRREMDRADEHEAELEEEAERWDGQE